MKARHKVKVFGKPRLRGKHVGNYASINIGDKVGKYVEFRWEFEFVCSHSFL
jgi:hypothetical protein